MNFINFNDSTVGISISEGISLIRLGAIHNVWNPSFAQWNIV